MLDVRLAGRSFEGPLPELTEDEVELRGRLKSHVRVLAGEIGERNVLNADALAQAEDYIRRAFGRCGVEVAEQTYEMALRTPLMVRNIEVDLAGTSSPGEIVIVGGHYDTVAYCAGANDNATGVAAVLELARMLSGRRVDRTVPLAGASDGLYDLAKSMSGSRTP